MIINGKRLIAAKPLTPLLDHKAKENGVSHGLAEVGYDIRIKQDVNFERREYPSGSHWRCVVDHFIEGEKFCIASTIERFQMPDNLVGVVHDKSTWARKGLSVFNTIIEPSWYGYLTLELVYHGDKDLHIPAGSGIAQVIFHEIAEPAFYHGKYQNQADKPVAAIMEK